MTLPSEPAEVKAWKDCSLCGGDQRGMATDWYDENSGADGEACAWRACPSCRDHYAALAALRERCAAECEGMDVERTMESLGVILPQQAANMALDRAAAAVRKLPLVPS